MRQRTGGAASAGLVTDRDGHRRSFRTVNGPVSRGRCRYPHTQPRDIGPGNAYLAAVLGNAAAGAAKTDTFLGERYRRIARRRGSKRAIVAVGRSILVIAWHPLSDPEARFTDLGPGFHATRIDPERRKHSHIRQLEALGYKVTLQPAT
jgi:hypothetical protein